MSVMIEKQEEKVVPLSAFSAAFLSDTYDTLRDACVWFSFTFFMLKTLERVQDTHLRMIIERKPFSKSKHAFPKAIHRTLPKR